MNHFTIYQVFVELSCSAFRYEHRWYSTLTELLNYSGLACLVKRAQQSACDQKYKTEFPFDLCVYFTCSLIITINGLFFHICSHWIMKRSNTRKGSSGARHVEQSGKWYKEETRKEWWKVIEVGINWWREGGEWLACLNRLQTSSVNQVHQSCAIWIRFINLSRKHMCG